MALENPTNVDKEIDQGILRDYLGIEDGSDIDFGTYKTLIKEKITAARMGGSDMDSGDIDILTKEFIRIKKIPVPDDQVKPKIDAKKFFAEQEKAKEKTEEKEQDKKETRISQEKFLKTAQNTINETKEKVSPQLLLPGTATPQQEEKEEDQQEDVKKGIDEVSLKLTDLEENLKSILETLKNQFKLDKEEEKKEDNLEAREKRKAREAKLEDKAGEKTDKSINKKVVKPVKGIFDMIMDFFKNILLGGALLFLLKILQDPKKYLQPLIDAFNSVLEFFNGIIRAINGFINEFNFWILKPISNFVIGPIYGAFNFIEDRINDVLKLFGQNPLNNIPNQAPQIQIPKIPEIPLFDPFNTLPQNQQKPPPPKSTPAQGLEGGGVVLNNTTNVGDVNVQTMSEGGKVNSNTGKKVKGMGADTQMVALQPGEIVMSKPAVQYHGANKLLAMNKEGGGTNVPKQGTVTGMQGGGMVGYGSNLSYPSPVPDYPNYKKPSDSFGQFFAQIYKAAKKYGDPFPEVVAAQAVEESNFGKSMLAKEAFNLFGQDAPPSYPASRKYDYIDPIEGKHTAIKFKSFDESVKYRVKLWKQYYGSAKTPSEAIRNIAAEGYNPHSVYPGKIEAVMREYGVVPNLPSPIKSAVTPTTKKVSSEPAVDNRSMLQRGMDWAMTKGKQILGFSGGGIAGGTAGSPRDPKNRKIFLHWTGGFHNGNSSKYHQVFNGAGKPMTAGVNYGVDKNSHTKGANTNSVGLSAAALGHTGMTPRYYDDKKGWAESPLTNAQTTAMAKEAAGLMRAYGQTAGDVDKNVMTHGEWERYAVKTGKLPAPVQRWDLDSLTPGPYSHPGGFWSTQQVKSKGGDQMRSKIKSFLSGSAPQTSGEKFSQPPSAAKFTSAQGVDSSNFGVFQSMSESQRSRFLSAQVGTSVDGTRVTSKLQFQLQKYLIAESKFKKAQVVSPKETVTSPSSAISPSQTTRVAPGPRQPSTSVVTTAAQNGRQVPPGATPQSAASGGAQNTVPVFDSTDSMNTETLIIKSIYSLVG